MIKSGEKYFVVPSLQACCQGCNSLDAREITYITVFKGDLAGRWVGRGRMLYIEHPKNTRVDLS